MYRNLFLHLYQYYFFLPSKGGCPYPKMDGQKVAELLQQEYRMPKPQHVDDEL